MHNCAVRLFFYLKPDFVLKEKRVGPNRVGRVGKTTILFGLKPKVKSTYVSQDAGRRERATISKYRSNREKNGERSGLQDTMQ